MLKWKPNTKFFWVKNCESTQLRQQRAKGGKVEKPVKSHVHIFVSRSLLAGQRKAFSMTKKKNSSFKRTLPQLLNMHTLDAITF